ncbi:LacI family DNA-binding transcriptional regulator [Amycolatopsis sp. NPDC051758]|uniref:LacI family DNA-binding transcriptional regulator n=1 Tax=Amycolatopsis sp. NPDC051758 TaxID=3363935 RepID=UPI0037BB3640
MVTRRDVARKAGTSEAVVSYVLNDGPRNVAPATRARVEEAIRELGYRANTLARSLRLNRTMTIGLVTPDSSHEFYGYLARAIENVAFDAGYTTLLGNAMENLDREAKYVRTLLDRQVDGLIVAPVPGSTVVSAELAQGTIPFVILDRGLADEHVVQVTVDNEGGAYEATEHLLGHGRKRVACLAGPETAHTIHARVSGWRRCLADHGVDPGAMWLTYGGFRLEDGYRAAARILASDEPPDAIFATSDEQALGAIRAAVDRGLHVPEALALMGFDGIHRGPFSVPSLSTVQQPLEALAEEAFGRLKTRIDGAPAAEVPPRVFATELVLRESCGCSGGP